MAVRGSGGTLKIATGSVNEMLPKMIYQEIVIRWKLAIEFRTGWWSHVSIVFEMEAGPGLCGWVIRFLLVFFCNFGITSEGLRMTGERAEARSPEHRGLDSKPLHRLSENLPITYPKNGQRHH